MSSDLSKLLVCQNYNCKFNRNLIDCELMTEMSECQNINRLEIIESPWHKDYKNSTLSKRIEWDLNNKAQR
ncbi:MAG: hypothetical protein GY793_05910 [Proteobacteria bacterium]|nr:hypothetical protein [Pseudomonadota bacterium]